MEFFLQDMTVVTMAKIRGGAHLFVLFVQRIVNVQDFDCDCLKILGVDEYGR